MRVEREWLLADASQILSKESEAVCITNFYWLN